MDRVSIPFWLILLACSGCSKPVPSPTADLPPLEGTVVDESRIPQPGGETPESIAVSQILCSYHGAQDALLRHPRSRAHARERCQHLATLARTRDSDFIALARQFSDDSKTSGDGGDLGSVTPGDLHPDVERVAFALGLGQVSDPIETPYGFHVLSRREPNEAQAGEILVSFTGAARYTPREARTREQARDLADQIRSNLGAGASFEEEAIATSDLPNHRQGGIFPLFRRGGQHPEFEKIVWSLAPGEISAPLETSTGFHIVKRFPIRKVQVRQILVGFMSGDSEIAEILRTHDEARSIIEEVHHRLQDPAADFAELALRFSDADSKQQGGLLEPMTRGTLAYPVEQVAFRLQVGEISPVVGTEAGFTIIKRVR